MNFFQAQEKARRSTIRLVVMFALAIIALVLMTNLLIMAVLLFYSDQFDGNAITGGFFDSFVAVFDWQKFWWISSGVSLVVLLGSLYKIISLSAGGKVVAEMLGGQRIPRDSHDPDYRKVLNVVEEMSIASGSPMPTVYLLSEEQGINAFAAGNSPGDAVIGVTKGCISLLNRDQLQGVIAHEFSHIINGDMRLNIRIMGILHGIVVIGMIGYYMLPSRTYSRRRDNGGAQLVLALGFMFIGFAGSFFGSMIKASVSRQREYLADASAVQFTRNPDGIANALKKIGGYSHHSDIDNPAAAGISHAFFATGVSSLFTDVFATHPPLEKRIISIQPGWNGKFPTVEVKAAVSSTVADKQTESLSSQSSSQQALVAAAVMDSIQNIGQPSSAHLGYAMDFQQSIPEEIRAAIRESYNARALVYALIISDVSDVRQKQMRYLNNNADEGVYAATEKLLPKVRALNSEFRLPLIDLLIATLREMSPQQYQKFKKNFQVLVEADKKINLFEWALQKILFKNLDAEFIKQSILRSNSKYSSIKALMPEMVVLLSLLAHSEHVDLSATKAAFKHGVESLGQKSISMLGKDDLSLHKLNQAIDKLTLLKPLLKPAVLKACVACIASDNVISPSEAELLRAFSAALDCPMPPFIMSGS